MKEKLLIEIPGEAVAKQRPRVALRGSYPKVYTPKETVNYETYVKVLFTERYPDHIPYKSALRLTVDVYRSIPASQSEKKKEMMRNGEIKPVVKPDLDNIIKIICDSLNKIAYADDNVIVDIRARKFYSDIPKVVVEIEEI